MRVRLVRLGVFVAALSMTWAAAAFASTTRRVTIDELEYMVRSIGIPEESVSVGRYGGYREGGASAAWTLIELRDAELDLFGTFSPRWGDEGAARIEDGAVSFTVFELGSPWNALEVRVDAR